MRARTIKPGVGIILPEHISKKHIAQDELRMGEAMVYRFLDAESRCLYIGVTESPLNRLQAHRSKPWWGEVASIYYVAGLSAQDAWRLERESIFEERPKYNRTVGGR